MKCWKAVSAVAILAFAAPVWGAVITPANNSFETPQFGGFRVGYSGGAPTVAEQGGAGWTFSGGGAGITHNGSGFGPPSAQDGTQAGLLQGAGATASQTIDGFADGTVTVSLYAAARGLQLNNATAANPLSVTLDGVPLTFGAAATITPAVNTYNLYTSNPFVITAGSHTLAIAGQGPPNGTDDVTSFIDLVTLDNTAVPEPASLGLFTAAALGVLVRRRRRQG